MILDTITNAVFYSSLHPDFAEALELMQSLDFHTLPDGQIPCTNPNIRIFIGSEPMRSREAAYPEVHQYHVDIQIPISSSEGYGWIEKSRLKNGLGYDEQRDIEFFTDAPDTWFEVVPGQFALFFPTDAHAPLVGNQPYIRKAVFKIRTESIGK